MERDIFIKLIAWKKNTRRKPLLLMGARQVGKTHTLLAFGKQEYTNVVYLNFESSSHLKNIFLSTLQPQEIIKLIEIDQETQIGPGKTLLIFDEVQECPEALNSLKYFHESTNEYHVCAAGSLLGVKLAHTKGFPVGKVNFLTLYPLSFFEYLSALGESQLRTHLESTNIKTSLAQSIHEKAMSLFKYYLYIGGMPEAVAEYVETKEIFRVREIQNEILLAYQLDFVKHAPPNQVMRITQVWNAIPSQLAKENRKFIYSAIRKGARAKEFELALQWLTEAGLIAKVTQVNKPGLPLNAYANFENFKIYALDVGLLGAMTQLSAKTLINGNQLFTEFKGAYTENYTAQALQQIGQALFYWSSEGKAEIDFLIQSESTVYPLEIKSGFSNQKKSLGVYKNKYQPPWSIRCSPMNLTVDGSLLNCPLYLISQLDRYIQML